MGLNQESLRKPSGEMRAAFSGISPVSSEIQPNRFPVIELKSEKRPRELSRMLFATKNEDEKEAGNQPQAKTPRKDGFEPFVNPELTKDPLFENGYTGNYSQVMKLNRAAVERVLEIFHLEGKVFLTSLLPNRQRSIKANPDGSVSAKRFMFFGEKTQKYEEENPLVRVLSVPEGWRMEINDTRILEELQNRNLTGKKLQKEFINDFNEKLKQGV